jgi:tetratricopeptide (TPR) repeat protein
MDFSERLDQAWSLHAEAPDQVAQTLKDLFEILNSEDEAVAFLELSVHVIGGHQGRWEEAGSWVNKLAQHQLGSSQQLIRAIEIKRQAIALASGLAAGREGEAVNTPDDACIQARAEAADLLAEQDRCSEAKGLLREIDLELLPDSDRSTALAVAMSSNNLAWKLLESGDLSDSLDLAQLSLRAWSVAGGWIEVERAHYLISKCHAALGRGEDAVKSAEECLSICELHGATLDELFYACEGVALAYAAAGQKIGFYEFRARARKIFDQLQVGNQAMCGDAMQNLDNQKFV